MPQRPCAWSLKRLALKSVAKNCDLIAYGCTKGSQQVNNNLKIVFFEIKLLAATDVFGADSFDIPLVWFPSCHP